MGGQAGFQLANLDLHLGLKLIFRFRKGVIEPWQWSRVMG